MDSEPNLRDLARNACKNCRAKKVRCRRGGVEGNQGPCERFVHLPISACPPFSICGLIPWDPRADQPRCRRSGKVCEQPPPRPARRAKGLLDLSYRVYIANIQ
jgi:hypothetical protein